MQVTVFIEELQEQSMVTYGAAWYIMFSNHKILFIMNSFEKFYSQVREWEIPVEEMDMIVLLQSGRPFIREIEYFLTNNYKARIYLPRTSNEIYLRSICHKLSVYTTPGLLRQWKERVVFTDEFVYIGNDIQIFTGKKQKIRGGRQSIILSNHETRILFVNDREDTTEIIQEMAETLSGKSMNYLFYQDENSRCIKKNCRTYEQTIITSGQTVVIDEYAEKEYIGRN